MLQSSPAYSQDLVDDFVSIASCCASVAIKNLEGNDWSLEKGLNALYSSREQSRIVEQIDLTVDHCADDHVIKEEDDQQNQVSLIHKLDRHSVLMAFAGR